MCFVRLFSWWFVAKKFAPVLSACKAIGTFSRTSWRPFRNHWICRAASDIATYSASVVDVATEHRFLDRQEIQAPLKSTMYPENERRVSRQAAKSAST